MSTLAGTLSKSLLPYASFKKCSFSKTSAQIKEMFQSQPDSPLKERRIPRLDRERLIQESELSSKQVSLQSSRKRLLTMLQPVIEACDDSSSWEAIHKTLVVELVRAKDWDLLNHLFKDYLLPCPGFDLKGDYTELYLTWMVREEEDPGLCIQALHQLIESSEQNRLAMKKRLTTLTLEYVMHKALQVKCRDTHTLITDVIRLQIPFQFDWERICRQIYLPHGMWSEIDTLVSRHQDALTIDTFIDIFDTILQPDADDPPLFEGELRTGPWPLVPRYHRLLELLERWAGGLGIKIGREPIMRALERCMLYLHFPPPMPFLTKLQEIQKIDKTDELLKDEKKATLIHPIEDEVIHL